MPCLVLNLEKVQSHRSRAQFSCKSSKPDPHTCQRGTPRELSSEHHDFPTELFILSCVLLQCQSFRVLNLSGSRGCQLTWVVGVEPEHGVAPGRGGQRVFEHGAVQVPADVPRLVEPLHLLQARAADLRDACERQGQLNKVKDQHMEMQSVGK